MTAWSIFILAGLLADFALGAMADLLNLRALSPGVPAELRGVYDPERYRRAIEYTRVRTRFGLVTAAVDLGLVLALWLSGGFGWLDRSTRGLGLGAVATGLVFLGTLALGRMVIATPLGWWSTFVIEERFGFNRMTARTFWADRAKGLLLTVVLGGPLLAAVLWLFVAAGPRAWLWAWLAGSLWVLALEVVAPAWIMPLFNRFAPLDAGAVRDAILAYARSVAFPLEAVFVIDGSRRSTKANALFTGVGRRKRIALFDTLLTTFAPHEVVAVVAHEVGHYKLRHVLQGTVLGILQIGAALFLLSVLLGWPGPLDAFGLAPSAHAGLLVFALVTVPLARAASVVMLALSRRNEHQADAFAAATTGSGGPLADALARLAADSLAPLTPHPLHVLLHASHPPVVERIRALRAAPRPA
jgi:STE24 endopeptidase